ncbi:MurR/RpiR family transcriptional regulator [Subtercola sp. Z020]|nr:MurR/RpiR family transcriptional regulator [Subtercola sp. Z020]
MGQRIADAYGELSPQEQRAADVILDHLDDLAVYNASELAGLSGVSKATVSRLFRSLGYADAQEVRAHARALRGQGVPLGGITLGSAHAAAASAATAPAAPAPAAPAPAAIAPAAARPGIARGAATGPTPSPTPTLEAHLERELANLRAVLALAADGRLAAAAGLIAQARRVVVIGLRNSYPVALHLREQLVQGLADVRLAPQPGQSIAEELRGLTAADAVVLVGFRRRPAGFSRIVDAAAALGAPVILLADDSAERHAARAAVWLECPVQSVVALDSYAAANSLVALLATETLGHSSRTTRTRIAAINRLYTDLDELESPR